mgnify:FL=1|nr:MAG TPA: hypothetical protein [Caudoviricetes sp.]
MFRSLVIHEITQESYEHTLEATQAAANLLADRLNQLAINGPIDNISLQSLNFDAVPTRTTRYDYAGETLEIQYKGRVTGVLIYNQ